MKNDESRIDVKGLEELKIDWIEDKWMNLIECIGRNRLNECDMNE